jgi:hypothetical protein
MGVLAVSPFLERFNLPERVFEFVFITVAYHEISGTKGQVMLLPSGGVRPL